jgi:hypothetical protein
MPIVCCGRDVLVAPALFSNQVAIWSCEESEGQD